jgi:hypothetical protein
VLHSHIGFDAMITDYIPKKSYPKTEVTFRWGLRTATVAVLLGIYEFETNEVGMFPSIDSFRNRGWYKKSVESLSGAHCIDVE